MYSTEYPEVSHVAQFAGFRVVRSMIHEPERLYCIPREFVESTSRFFIMLKSKVFPEQISPRIEREGCVYVFTGSVLHHEEPFGTERYEWVTEKSWPENDSRHSRDTARTANRNVKYFRSARAGARTLALVRTELRSRRK